MEVVAPKVKRRIVGKQDVRMPEEKKIATIEKVYSTTRQDIKTSEKHGKQQRS